ncbi:MAG TPA: N-formylglutamate amidohydrolase [Novosphingobium sp.]|nr:N-formylglutamate amidohydrolase [Novosphingobium sp.]
MLFASAPSSDSIDGGSIPGLAEVPAFRLSGSAASPVPVLIAVPHAGRAYPRALLSAMRDAEYAAPRLEDRLVDALAREVARATGAALLVANAPRAMLDLNRAADDVDWEMIADAPVMTTRPAPGRRARSGLGLVPRRLPGRGEIWRGRLERSELEARIAGIHTPYHATIDAVLADMRARWGAALLIDFHSMPPLAARASGAPAAEFVIGDRFGGACDGALVGAAFAHFAENGRRAAHNRPYAGGYALERHAAPRRGIHALQLEVDRGAYLDPSLREPGTGMDDTAALLAGWVRRLADEAALLGGERATDWAVAAE